VRPGASVLAKLWRWSVHQPRLRRTSEDNLVPMAAHIKYGEEDE